LINRRTRPLLPRRSGFTLIELLVVILLISIIIGAGMLSVSVGERGRVQEVMRNTVSIMNAVADEAILSGRRYAMVWDDHGHHLRALCHNEAQRNWECTADCFPGGCEQLQIALQPSWKILFQDPSSGEFSAILERADDADDALDDDANDDAYNDDWDGESPPEKKPRWKPIVQFHPTGLWEPSGALRVVYDQQQSLSLNWTATGRVRFGEREDS